MGFTILSSTRFPSIIMIAAVLPSSVVNVTLPHKQSLQNTHNHSLHSSSVEIFR